MSFRNGKQARPATEPRVLVTGASTGIGRATAQYLGERGFRVFAGVRRSSDAESLRSACSDRIRPVMLDVEKAGTIQDAAQSVATEVGTEGLQGLVNNAGVTIPAFLEYLDVDLLRRQLEVNVVGVAAVTKAFLPLIRLGTGRIVNVGSLSGFFAVPMNGCYAASKSALKAMTDSLRRELNPWGIRVSIVEPGVTSTPIWQKTERHCTELRQGLPESGVQLYGRWFDFISRYIDDCVRRAMPPERVARAVFRALTARHPRTRYPVGIDARLMRWAVWALPARVIDVLVARAWMAARRPEIPSRSDLGTGSVERQDTL